MFHVYKWESVSSCQWENSRHGYMTLENGEFLWKDFDGDILKTYTI